MTGHRALPVVGVLAAFALVLAGCQEKLAAPGECPGICPGDRSEIRDTTLLPVFGRDSTYTGYIAAGQGASLRLSSGLGGVQERGVVRFVPRPDSVTINAKQYPYTIDSVALSVALQARDPAATNLHLVFYRLPSPRTVDSTRTFADIESALLPANVIDSVPIPDSLRAGTIRRVFAGADLARIALPPADSGVLALGLRLSSSSPTGVRIGSGSAGSLAPSFVTYFTAQIADTALQRQPPLPRLIAYNGFVASVSAPVDNSTITVGGAPSSRALIRFEIPARLRDSTSIVRATLELTPVAPIGGLPTDSVALDIRAVLADLGAKSPRLANIPSQIVIAPLLVGSSDTVRVDITSLADLWQPPNRLPTALFIALQPEGASFTRAVFGSTRNGVAIRLRLTYAIPFPFETP